MVTMGKTMLLATVCSAKDAAPGTDFMPLSVDYKEKFAANGRFPGALHVAKAALLITKFSYHVWLTALCAHYSQTIITLKHLLMSHSTRPMAKNA